MKLKSSMKPAAAPLAALRALQRPRGVVGAVRADQSEEHQIETMLRQVHSELTRVGEKAIKGVEKLELKLEALETRNADLEKVVASRTGALARLRYGGASAGTFAAALDCDAVRNAVKLYESHGRTRFSVNAAILSGGLPAADRRPGIVEGARRTLRVRDLLRVTPTTEGSIEYIRQTGFTNAAAPVTEGELKPETTMTFDLVTTTPSTIAHWTQASKQVLADVSRLQSFLDSQMRYGVQLVEDAQLLFGSGTGLNLSGLATEATAFSAPARISLTTQADFIGAAIAQLRGIDHEPDGVVMHPNDWQRILQEKGSDGHYIVPGGPFSTAEPMLFQKPIALTTAMEQDSFLVGQFAVGAEIFEREETTVEISTEDRDNFIRNLVTVRAEERIILATYQPEAFVVGDFGNIT